MKTKCHTTPFDLLLPHGPCFVLSRPLSGERAVPACVTCHLRWTHAHVLCCDAMRCAAKFQITQASTHTHAAAIRRLAIPAFDAIRCDLLCFAFPALYSSLAKACGYGGFDHGGGHRGRSWRMLVRVAWWARGSRAPSETKPFHSYWSSEHHDASQKSSFFAATHKN